VAGVTWPLDPDMTDGALMGRMFVNGGVRLGARFHAEPDWAVLARELKRPGVNLMILWEEYRASHPEGYAYSRFCELFRAFERRLSPTMRQQHVAGHKAFVDYAGKRVPIVDPSTGELRMAEIFVAVLGASSLTYAEATWSQTLSDCCLSLEFVRVSHLAARNSGESSTHFPSLQQFRELNHQPLQGLTRRLELRPVTKLPATLQRTLSGI
jgi:transposase